MLSPPADCPNALSRFELDQFEKDWFTFYSQLDRNDLISSLQDLLSRIVKLRRLLHRSLVDRDPDSANAAVSALLALEAQAAAIRRLIGDLPIPAPVPSGPHERRRTARS